MSDTFLGVRMQAEAVRELAFSSISGTYAAVGVILANPSRAIMFKNTCDKDIYISWDSGVTNHMRLVAGTADTIDEKTNGGLIAQGTLFEAKQTSDGAPTKGNIIIQTFFA